MSLTGEPPLTNFPSISSSSSWERGERSLFCPFVCARRIFLSFFSAFFPALFSHLGILAFLTVSGCKLPVESGEAGGESPSTNFLVPAFEGVTGEWILEAVVGAEVSEGGARIFSTTGVGGRREGDLWANGKGGVESVLGEGGSWERGERGEEERRKELGVEGGEQEEKREIVWRKGYGLAERFEIGHGGMI